MVVRVLTEKRGSFEVTAAVFPMGEGLLVSLTGGEAHIGAIGIGEPKEEGGDAGEPQTSEDPPSVVFPGHREDVVAGPMARRLAHALKKKTVVVAGMHWNGINSNDIQNIEILCDILSDKIIGMIQNI